MTLSADLPGFICGIQAGAADVVHDRRINADKIDIKKGTDGIQMHRCAHFRQLTDNHALRAALFKQRARQPGNCLRTGALAHSDQYDPLPNRHDISAFQGLTARRRIDIAPPYLDCAGKARVKAINRRRQERLPPPRRPEHRMQDHAIIYPRAWVALKNQIGERRNDEVRVFQRAPNKPRASNGSSDLATPPVNASASRCAGSSSSQSRLSRSMPMPISSSLTTRSSIQSRASEFRQTSPSRCWSSSTSMPRDCIACTNTA